MELSELTAYAEGKFHMREQYKWADFPGFSVLADPNTGKWIALLMRQWDYDTGTEIQRCDLKCGQPSLSEMSEPYLSQPFRMKGKKWIGVKFENNTNPDVVFRLFDRAVYAEESQGYTIVLEHAPVQQTVIEPDMTLPAVDTQIPVPETTQIPAPASGISAAEDLKIPDRIYKMLSLYRYGSNSFLQKCSNFYRQGKFMEDYEDDVRWAGAFRHYFPVYHDLNIKQLRGYFSWRTHVRKGEFLPIAISMAYIYLYELLNGIGADSPEDALEKMKAFETNFLNAGLGDSNMQKNLRRWMLEYAVIHNIPADEARQYADPEVIAKDDALAVLKNPEESSDEEIFCALCTFAGKKLEQSSAIKKGGPRGKHLFAAVWKYAAGTYSIYGKDIFTACFGVQKSFVWRPLSDAVYWEEHRHADTDYVLDASRTYRCRSGMWREKRYNDTNFDPKKFGALMHEADRQLRQYMKTGHYLRKNAGEAWAAPYVEAVIQADRQAQIEAARPKITINLSNLDQIRQDALITRDSLLTEEEMGETVVNDREKQPVNVPDKPEAQEAPLRQAEENFDFADAGNVPVSLDEPHRQILMALIHGRPIDTYIKADHLMPSIVADTINEAFFDEIGDNILECDGDAVTVVEDYREDILKMFGGKA